MSVSFGAASAALFLFAEPVLVREPIEVALERSWSFLAFASAALATGLPFYPLVAAIQRLQCRSSRIDRFPPDALGRLLASRWQSFAYPLPGLRRFLVEIARRHGPEAGLQAIQTLQGTTTQTYVISRAVIDLARDYELGLAFTTLVAEQANRPTVMSLALSSQLSHSLAIVAGAERPDNQPSEPPPWVQLDLPRLPHPSVSFGWRLNRARAERLATLQALQRQPFLARSEDALADLEAGQSTDGPAFRNWLLAVRRHLQTSSMSDYQPVGMPDSPPWLSPAWQMLGGIQAALVPLRDYGRVATAESRRQLLEVILANLRRYSSRDTIWLWRVPWLWAAVEQELVGHFTKLVSEEMAQAREWLRLDVALPEQTLRAGRASLKIAVKNPTGVIAKNLALTIQDCPGIHWRAKRLAEPSLEGRREVELILPLTSEQAGDYLIDGTIEASDLSGSLFTKPFSFQLHVGKLGKPYQHLPSSTYTTGPAVSSDRAFVNRTEIFRWLAGIWGTADSKEAAVLVGQRRIGKSSILNRLERAGLEGTGLLPARIDVQPTNSPYAFLQELAGALARAAKVAAPALDQQEPFVGLTGFARGLSSALGERRILLMIDEADLLEKQVGPSVLGLLRGLMQDPAYPVVMLFCGTHALRRMSQDYQSIFFNTARTMRVSYMSKEESAEVLRKPVGDGLSFDPAALAEAFRLTAGQPYLLQVLGSTILEDRNRALDEGKAPDSFVDLQDMERAAQTAASQDNAAFENYWRDRAQAQRRVLAGMASVPEAIRAGTRIPDLEQLLGELRMPMPRAELVAALEALVEEEFLGQENAMYQFRVPLFRRWIAAKHIPAIVREVPL